MKSYKVLWFDDHFQSTFLQEIADKAHDKYSIELVGFISAEDGLKYLERNYKKIDAILLDARFLLLSTDVSGSEDLKGLSKVWNNISQLDGKGFVIPRFILSGQDSLSKDSTFKEIYGDFYSKHSTSDIDKLFSDIVDAANNRLETTIRHKYNKVFNICTEKYIGENAADILFDIIKSIENPYEEFDDKLYFTQIRIILEMLFRSANKFGLLHDICVNPDGSGKVNLAESSLFMRGERTKHLNVYCSENHFNKIISESVKNILFITGAASHTSDPEIDKNIDLSKYRTLIRTPYLLYSLTFQLMDILIWFKEYVDRNSNYQSNILKWKTSIPSLNTDQNVWIEGKLSKIDEKGWGTFKPLVGNYTIGIPPSMVRDNHLTLHEEIKIKTKVENGKTLIKELITVMV